MDINKCIDLIENIKKLSENDKKLYKHAILNNDYSSYLKMSIFCNSYTKMKLDNYNYIVTTEKSFYVNLHFFRNPIFINKNKQIYIHSFQILFNMTSATKILNNILNAIDSINLNTTVPISKNVIAISKFNTLYGHFKDEIFCLCDFYEKFNSKNAVKSINFSNMLNNTQNISVKKNNNGSFDSNEYIPLIEYKHELTNYNEIKNLLFGNKCINPNVYGKSIIKINKVVIVEHHLNLDTFHSFPLYSKNVCLKKLSKYPLKTYENVFITRSQSSHTNRLFNNISQVTEHFKTNNYVIINPETMSYAEFIIFISNSKNVYITWGSALVNLIYLNKTANIYILKSKSYKDENLSIFRNLIKNYEFNVKVIETDENDNIKIPFLPYVIKEKNKIVPNKFGMIFS